MTYSAKDLERAKAFLSEHKDSSYHLDHSAHEMADLLATVRRETIEECINACRPVGGSRHEGGLYVAMERIRALLDEPEAEPEPCCGEFGTGSGMHGDECPNAEEPGQR